MNKKIVYVDLDDTLLTTDKKICKKNIDAIHKMTEEGHYFAVNTGRPLYGAKKIVDCIGMGKNCFILSFHGTHVYDCYKDEIINTNAMDNCETIKLCEAIDDYGIYVQALTAKGIYTKFDNDVLKRYNTLTNEPVIFIDSYNELKDLDINKVMAIDFNNHNKLVEFQNYYKDKEVGVFNSFFSCLEYLEYTLEGADKGNGVRFLANYLNVPIENTICIGDERNDISMIAAAGIGVAMQNAVSQVKDVADYITENDNNNSGVSEVIEKFVLE